jgi:Flp pilus assembly pilin Flp
MYQQEQRMRGVVVGWLAGAHRRLVQLVHEDDGVSTIEYGLLAAVIVLAASAAIASLGSGVDGVWTRLSERLIAVFSGAGS